MKGTIYFHSPCFDGIASAVLIADFLQARGWPELRFRAVNYDRRAVWLTKPLARPAAVVDFLYHPDAAFWADHHGTTFLTDTARADFAAKRRDPAFVYDAAADSCAGLLWRHLDQAFGFRSARQEELVRWAEKTDAARYESVDEVFAAKSPALRIHAGLALATKSDCVELVQALRTRSLAAVARLPEVKRRSKEALARQKVGLARFRPAAQLTPDGIVTFDVQDDAHGINRYSPYRIYPDARYSAGITRDRRFVQITTMRNPWREFACAPLGELCAAVAAEFKPTIPELSGGGHPRVGGMQAPAKYRVQAPQLLTRLVERIRAFHPELG